MNTSVLSPDLQDIIAPMRHQTDVLFAKYEGMSAYYAKGVNNPYESGTDEHEAWNKGFFKEMQVAERLARYKSHAQDKVEQWYEETCLEARLIGVSVVYAGPVSKNVVGKSKTQRFIESTQRTIDEAKIERRITACMWRRYG